MLTTASIQYRYWGRGAVVPAGHGDAVDGVDVTVAKPAGSSAKTAGCCASSWRSWANARASAGLRSEHTGGCKPYLRVVDVLSPPRLHNEGCPNTQGGGQMATPGLMTCEPAVAGARGKVNQGVSKTFGGAPHHGNGVDRTVLSPPSMAGRERSTRLSERGNNTCNQLAFSILDLRKQEHRGSTDVSVSTPKSGPQRRMLSTILTCFIFEVAIGTLVIFQRCKDTRSRSIQRPPISGHSLRHRGSARRIVTPRS